MSETIIEQHDLDICEMKKELEFIKKQSIELESMLWSLDEQHKEYNEIIHKQAIRDTRYIALFVLMNLLYLWWIHY
jgi:hypothetical protein